MRKGAKTRPRIEFVIRESTKPVDHVSFVLSPSSLPPPSFCPLLYRERFNFASFVHILTAKRFFLLPFPFSFFFFFPLPLVIGRLSTETTECTCYRLAWNFLAPIFSTTYLEKLLLKSIPALLSFSLLSPNGSEFVEILLPSFRFPRSTNRSERRGEEYSLDIV